MKKQIKYLLFSSVLVAVCFLVIPLMLLYGSGDLPLLIDVSSEDGQDAAADSSGSNSTSKRIPSFSSAFFMQFLN